MRDEQWAARRKLVLQLNPAAAPEEKEKAGGKKGGPHGAKGGRGKKKTPCPKLGKGVSKPPSKMPAARAEAAAVKRVDGSAPGTWALYADGKLTTSQLRPALLVGRGLDCPAPHVVVAQEAP